MHRLAAFFFSLPLIPGLIGFTTPTGSIDFNRITLYDLQYVDFPRMNVFLSLTDSLGGRPSGWTSADISATEDGTAVRNPILSEVQVGARIVILIDPGPEMMYSLPDGSKRIDLLRSTIAGWLGSLPPGGGDDYSLITPEGDSVLHTADPSILLSGLRNYAPMIPATRSLPEILDAGLSAAGQPFPRPGMRAMILLVSAAAPVPGEDPAANACIQARAMNAPLFGIWAGRLDSSAQNKIDALQSLSAACGGYAVALENPIAVDTLLGNIARQRYQYLLEYESTAAMAGQHTLQVAVLNRAFPAADASITYTMDIQSPTVDWTVFPDTVQRSSSDSLRDPEEYLPTAADFSFTVTFPDGHLRSVESAELLVNHTVVAACEVFPCESLQWDMRRFTSPGAFAVQVVVRDELGLTGSTEERVLHLEIHRPTAWDIFQSRYFPVFSVVLAILAAGGLFFVVMLRMNLRRKEMETEPGWGGPSASETDDVPPRNRFRLRFHPADVSPVRSSSSVTGEIEFARLERVDGEGVPLVLRAPEVEVGRRSGGSYLALEDETVSERHARIVRMPDGTPWVFDLGSIAGTWLNYDPVSLEGCALRDGDILCFGRSAFRIRLPDSREGEKTN